MCVYVGGALQKSLWNAASAHLISVGLGLDRPERAHAPPELDLLALLLLIIVINFACVVAST